MKEKKNANDWYSSGLACVGMYTKAPVVMQNYYTHHLKFSNTHFNNLHFSTLKVKKKMHGTKEKNTTVLYQFLLHRGGFAGLLFLHDIDKILPVPTAETGLENIGIIALQLRCKNINVLRTKFLELGCEVSKLATTPEGNLCCFFRDPEHNWIYLYETRQKSSFMRKHTGIGSFTGPILGVYSIDQALDFYKTLLQYDTVVYDREELFEDFAILSENQVARRVKILKSRKGAGLFSHCLFGTGIELIQVSRKRNIEKNRSERPGESMQSFLVVEICGLEPFLEHCIAKNIFNELPCIEKIDNELVQFRYALIKEPSGLNIFLTELETAQLKKKNAERLYFQKVHSRLSRSRIHGFFGI